LGLDNELAGLLGASRQYLADCAEPGLVPVLTRWPNVNFARAPTPATLPVLRWLPAAVAAAPPASAPLARALAAAAPGLAWRQTYSAGALPAEFLDNYGWTGIVGRGGLVESDAFACGFLLLGPRTHYPSHQHEAEEFYWPLAGTAMWQQARAGWRRRSPGELIHHDRLETHAMRTDDEPLLALYLWQGPGLDQPAQPSGRPAGDS
jgi:hypothetical protein